MIVNWLPTALLSRKKERTLRSKVAKLPAHKTMRVERVEDRLVLSPQVILSPAPVGGFTTAEGVALAFDNVPAGAVPADPGVQITNNDPLAAADLQTITIDSTGGTLAGAGFAIVGTNKYEIQLVGVTMAVANADLKTLVFTPDTSKTPGGPDFIGNATISIKDQDLGNGSTILPSTATANFGIAVTPTYGFGNNVPTLTIGGLPGASQVITGTPLSTLSLNAANSDAISLTDPNVPATDIFTLTALVPNDIAKHPLATLSLTGLTPTITATVPGFTQYTWSGTLAQLQAGLAGATLTMNAGAVPATAATIILTATDVTHNPAFNTTFAGLNFAVIASNSLAPTVTTGSNTGYNPAAGSGLVAPNATVTGPTVTKVTLTDTIVVLPGNPAPGSLVGDKLTILPPLAALLLPGGSGTIATGTNITVTFAGNTATLTGTDTAANYQKVIDAISFVDTQGDVVNARATTIASFNGTAVGAPVVSVLLPQGAATNIGVSSVTATVGQNTTNNPIGGVVVTDPNYTGPINVVMTPTSGTFTVNTATSGVTVTANAPGSPPGTLTFFGSVAQVNAALAALSYTPTTGATGSASINIMVTESNAPFGIGVGNVTINVTPFAGTPAVNIPSISTNVNTSTKLGISISDVGASSETVTVLVAQGTLSGTASGAATLTQNAPNKVTIAGSLADVNATLANLTYAPPNNFVGTDSVTVTALNNANNVGLNSSLITVNAVGVAPTITLPVATPTANAGGAAVAITGLSVTNNDLPAGTGTLTVTVSSAAGVSLNASGAAGNGTNSLTITGTQAAVNADLATLTFTAGASLTTGPVAVSVKASESIASKSATSSFNVQVQAGPQISGGNLGGTVSVKVNKVVDIFGGVTITDTAPNFGGGTLTVNLTGTSKNDKLSIHPGHGVQIVNHKVKVAGVVIGTFTSTAHSLNVALNTNATASNLETLIGAIAFHSTRVGSGDRTAALTLTDGTSPTPAMGSVTIHVHK